jgi:polysaccharide deacetylase family protein (PEP-CTERM system associated)
MKILTFDIEEWFHLLDHPSTRSEAQWTRFPSRIDENVERILRLLEEGRVNATFFCLGWIAEKYPHIIKKISDSGHEIACHSHYHQLAYSQTPNEFREDLHRAKSTIEDVLGYSIETYRIPGFSLTAGNLWAIDIIYEEGFSVDCSVFPASRTHGGLQGFTTDQPCLIQLKNSALIKEFPLNTYSILGNRFVFSGGGYFRLFPYFLLEYLFYNSKYVMTYFHPRDFDSTQPIIFDLSPMRKFKSYYGLKNAEGKLIKLLNKFNFIDVQTAVQSIDWGNARIIKI